MALPVFIDSGKSNNANVRLKTDNGTTSAINPSTNQVRATKFVGALTGNADTATKLKTARTIFGQSFNGSANVTGTMTCDAISCSGNINTGGQINMMTKDENKYIDARTGDSNSLFIRTTKGGDTSHHNMIKATRTGSVSLYYNNSKN